MTQEPNEYGVVPTPEGLEYVEALRLRLLELAQANGIPTAKPRATCPKATWRGKTFCAHSIPKLEQLAKVTGADYMSPIQGSYSTGTSASAGTHDGGGVGDMSHTKFTDTRDHQIMNLARDKCYLIYWDRDAISGVWSDHGHWLDPMCPNMSAPAAAQVIDFFNGKNGLANDGPDFGSRTQLAAMKKQWAERATTTVAKAKALFQEPTVTAQATTTSLSASPITNVKQLDTVVKAVSKVPGTHVFEYLNGNTWTAFRTVTTTSGTSTIQHKFSGTHPIRARFTPKDTAAYRPSVSNQVTVQTINLGGLVTTDAQLAALVKSQAESIASLADRVAQLEGRVGPPDPPEGPANPWAPVAGPLYGVDTSGHQTAATVQSIIGGTLVPNRAFRFAIEKATEGKGFVNLRYDEHIALYRQAKLLTGAYHFHWPTNDVLLDFQNFTRTAKLRLGEVVVLDAENWDQVHNYADMANLPKWEDRLAWDLRWLALAREHFGCVPWIYLNWNWIKEFRRAAGMTYLEGGVERVRPATEQTPLWRELTSHPLFLADYDHAPGQHPTVDGGWNAGVVVHQFTDMPVDQDYLSATTPHEVWWDTGVRRNAAA